MRRIVLLLSWMALAVLLTSGASWAQTEPEPTPAAKCNVANSDGYFVGPQGLGIAQTFTNTMSGKLTIVQAPVGVSGGSTNTSTGALMQITTVDPLWGNPTNNVLATAEVPSVETHWKTIVFDKASAASVVEGKKYALVLKPLSDYAYVGWTGIVGGVCRTGGLLWAETSPNNWEKDRWLLRENDGLFSTYVTEVETIAPTLTSVAPRDNAAGVALDANVEAGFSEAMDASTITDSTFTLTLDGTPVSATVSYDPTTKKATLNPNTALQADETYTAKVKGECGHDKTPPAIH